MQKIPTIFVRDPKPKCTPVTEEENPECAWVFRGEGVAYRKLDGINVKIEDGETYVRVKPETADYVEAGYEPICPLKHKRVLSAVITSGIAHDSIYEAIGDGIRGNPERAEWPQLVKIHPKPDQILRILDEPKRNYRDILGYLATHDMEGIVYHHPDGRMAKIKTKDFYHLKRSA
jgi:hypothetical protein